MKNLEIHYHNEQSSAQPKEHPKDYLERKVCPGCLSPASHSALEIASNPRAEEISFGDHGQFLSGYTNERVFFSYFRCQNCKLLFCPKYFDEQQLGFLYGSQPENMADVPLLARQKTQQSYYRLLKKHHRLQGNYLEIGADIGLFTRLCAHEPIETFYLYEPNQKVHEELESSTQGKQCVISANPHFSSKDVDKESLSTAIIIHTLDHVLNPRNLLSELYKSLQPGGCVLIVTHDESSFLAKILRKKWPPYTLQHPHLFNPQTMRLLLQSEGFDVLTINKTVNYFPITHFIKGGLTVLGLDKIPIPEFNHLIIPLKLGNMAAIARKPK